MEQTICTNKQTSRITYHLSPFIISHHVMKISISPWCAKRCIPVLQLFLFGQDLVDKNAPFGVDLLLPQAQRRLKWFRSRIWVEPLMFTCCLTEFKRKILIWGKWCHDSWLNKSAPLIRVDWGGWRSPKDQQGLHRGNAARVGGHHHWREGQASIDEEQPYGKMMKNGEFRRHFWLIKCWFKPSTFIGFMYNIIHKQSGISSGNNGRLNWEIHGMMLLEISLTTWFFRPKVGGWTPNWRNSKVMATSMA